MGVWHKPATRPCGEVDDQRFVLFANAVYYIAVVLKLHGGPACGGIAHMDVDCGSASLSRCQTLVSNLFWRDRQIRRLLGLGNVARDGARNKGRVV